MTRIGMIRRKRSHAMRPNRPRPKWSRTPELSVRTPLLIRHTIRTIRETPSLIRLYGRTPLLYHMHIVRRRTHLNGTAEIPKTTALIIRTMLSHRLNFRRILRNPLTGRVMRESARQGRPVDLIARCSRCLSVNRFDIAHEAYKKQERADLEWRVHSFQTNHTPQKISHFFAASGLNTVKSYTCNDRSDRIRPAVLPP